MKRVYESKRDGWIVALLWGVVTGVFPTRNPLSSPACSLDRLHIRYRQRRLGLMISPQDKAGFLQDLAVRSPGLSLTGDRIVRNNPK